MSAYKGSNLCIHRFAKSLCRHCSFPVPPSSPPPSQVLDQLQQLDQTQPKIELPAVDQLSSSAGAPTLALQKKESQSQGSSVWSEPLPIAGPCMQAETKRDMTQRHDPNAVVVGHTQLLNVAMQAAMQDQLQQARSLLPMFNGGSQERRGSHRICMHECILGPDMYPTHCTLTLALFLHHFWTSLSLGAASHAVSNVVAAARVPMAAVVTSAGNAEKQNNGQRLLLSQPPVTVLICMEVLSGIGSLKPSSK